MPRWSSIVALLLAHTACINDRLVACDDGTFCAAGNVCLIGGGCAGPAELAACAGMADGVTCFVGTRGGGTCRGGACIVHVCGNGRLEPGEACDDGNDVSGDGCNATCTSTGQCGNGLIDPGEECDCGEAGVASSCAAPNDATASDPAATCRADCRLVRCGNGVHDYGERCDDGNLVPGDGCTPDCKSDETCGNGVLDFFVDEKCDDGNTRNHDGCDKTCQPETPVWRQRALVPPGRGDAGVAYDPFRARIVMFGGAVGSTELGDTWEWTGTGWEQMTPPTSPAPRHAHGMAYDAQRRRVVLFGGRSVNTWLGDTWEWDGATWTQRAPATSPTARDSFGMTYDAVHHQVVLFGGRIDSSGNVDNETWTWDGASWSNASPATAPSARRDQALAYDMKRSRVVLFGGQTYNLATLNDTWEWDGSNWTDPMPSAPLPGRRTGHALAYDAALGEVVLFGGSGSGYFNDTWTWNGSRWLRLGCTPPNPRTDVALAFHVQRGHVVKLGGYCGVGCSGVQGYASVPEELQIISASSCDWVSPPSSAPIARDSAAMAYDSTRARVILHGGEDDVQSLLGDTWEWDGAAWRSVASGTPSPRMSHAMADDPARSQVVLVGGFDSSTDLDDTYTWNGTAWAPVVTPGPVQGVGFALACDATGDLVRFGNQAVPQTARWNGAWSELVPSMTPSILGTFAMAFDHQRRQTVLVGQDQIWEWDGATWARRLPTVTPGYRDQTQLAFDPLYGRTILFGGAKQSVGASNDTWAWNGTEWKELVIDQPVPPPRQGSVLVYDAARYALLVFGGLGNSSTLDDTWMLRWEGHGLDEACHSGIDRDDDGKLGCDDDECWPWCDPHCPPGATACDPNRPRCGDGTCDPTLESCHSCPGDCHTGCVAVCGDFVCEGNESATCPGDCL